jgi:hypothetical protein
MSAKQKLLVTAGALALALGIFALGRFTAQVRTEERVVYRDRVVEKEKLVEKKVQGAVRVQIVTREVPGPSGPTKETTKTIERGPVVTTLKSEGQVSSEKNLETLKLREPVGPRLLLGPTLGARFGDLAPVYGGQIMVRALGPLWLGASADSNGAFRAQAALAF